jgi:3-oxoacyl-[acyl-carrier-protein] synthase III
MSIKAKIVGTGSYLPEKILTNQALEKMVDTSDEWIVSRTGMKERRIAKDDEFTSDMAYEAAIKALENAEVSVEEVDFILVATLTPDYAFPSTACLLQARLKAERAGAMDIQAACTGYLYALSVAKSYVESGMYKTVLVVASEKLSSIINYKDRNTCILFGDGAAACVVSSQAKKRALSIGNISLGADGTLSDLLILPAGGAKAPASKDTVEANLHYLQMEGKEVFKHAVRRMESSSKSCMDLLGLEEKDINWIVPHQANMRIIEAIAKRFNVSMEKVYITIHKYGNTSASSIGIALDELLREKDLQAGDNLLLTAFGAGLTWGSSILTVEGTNE